MRQGKMLTITPREIVDTAQGEIGIIARKVTRSKVKKTFTIEVFDRAFAKWLRARRDALTPEQFVFGQLDGTRIEKDTFRRMRDELWESAGLEAWEYQRSTSASGKRQSTCKRVKDSDIHWHDLRHECGSTLGDAGVGQRQIQTVLGHSSWKTSERYTNPDRDHLRARMRDAFAQKKRRAG
jgi:site-specific recombinase XerC